MVKKILLWLLRLIPAFILLQTLFFKFSGSPESIYIFEKLGMEPAGRIGSGIVELIAAILILIPGKSPFGALIALCVMAGAILSHLTILGIEVQGDGGLLFIMAWIVFLCSLLIAILQRSVLLDTTLARKFFHRENS